MALLLLPMPSLGLPLFKPSSITQALQISMLVEKKQIIENEYNILFYAIETILVCLECQNYLKCQEYFQLCYTTVILMIGTGKGLGIKPSFAHQLKNATGKISKI